MKIYDVEYCEAQHMAVARLDHSAGTVALTGHVPWRRLPIPRGEFASLEVEESVKDGSTIYSAKVVVPLSRPVSLQGPCAFILRTWDGALLMGLNERPYPLALSRLTESGSSTEATRYRLELRWTGRYAPLPVTAERTWPAR